MEKTTFWSSKIRSFLPFHFPICYSIHLSIQLRIYTVHVFIFPSILHNVFPASIFPPKYLSSINYSKYHLQHQSSFLSFYLLYQLELVYHSTILSVYQSLCLPLYQSISLSAFHSTSLLVFLSFCLSAHLPTSLHLFANLDQDPNMNFFFKNFKNLTVNPFLKLQQSFQEI